MVEFEDPITETEYDPVGDPSGTLLQSVYAVAGITMTLLLLGIAQGRVLPAVREFIKSLLGVDPTGGEAGIPVAGD